MNTFKAFDSLLIISNNIFLFIHSHYQFEDKGYPNCDYKYQFGYRNEVSQGDQMY